MDEILSRDDAERELRVVIAGVRDIFNGHKCIEICPVDKPHPQFMEYGTRGPQRCCVGCRRSYGFLTSEISGRLWRRVEGASTEQEGASIMLQAMGGKYSDYWDDKYGFWSPVGCKLPDEMKSATCITFSCGLWSTVYRQRFGSRASRAVGEKLMRANKRIRDLRAMIGVPVR